MFGKIFDDKPADIVVSFLMPDKNDNSHLEYLSITSKLLMHDDFVKYLKKVNTKEEIFQLFE
ncbi:PTS sugar transporter subunit IIA [Companilactobacillus allii]|uniref:PTS sugar transporter subunit IIA n=1 Tax=Companilactobacillus allii TaxID=1847728 RepID=UPI0031FD9EC2